MRSSFIVALFLSLVGCSKSSKPVPNADLMPPPFDFVLRDNMGHSLLVNTSQAIRMWYVVNGQENAIDDIKIKPVLLSNVYRYYATTVLAPLRSSDKIAKTFYLQLDGGRTDTVYLDVVRLSQPVNGEYNQYNEVKFNGKAVVLDPAHQPSLFLLNQ